MKFLLFILIALSATAVCATELAIVAQDRVVLRAAPRDSAQQHALLWQGEALEVRAERLDFLQVYDHRRERAGFVRASQVRRVGTEPADAPGLLSVVRFLRDAPGAEALGIAFAAAYLRAASAEAVNGAEGIEALDALGTFADRLARRASIEHLELVARYGVNFLSNERGGRIYVCYDGEAFRRVLAMRSTPGQQAHAALALTRTECVPGDLRPLERRRVDEWRAEILDRVETESLPGYLRNRVLLQRASVWASLAYQRTRGGGAADVAAGRAVSELAGIDKGELAAQDARTYAEAAMRVSASRWAGVAVPVASGAGPQVATVPGAPGETCVLLIDAKNDHRRPLARRCTYSLVWAASASVNRDGSALALAIQPIDTWREIWLFRKTRSGWTIAVLPPAAASPGIGYAELAGWVPGRPEMLVARESLAEGKQRRSFEIVRLDSLATVRQASDPSILGHFQRWQDPSWKRETLSLR